MYIKKYKWNSSGMKEFIFYIEICFFKKISVLKRFLKKDSSWVKTLKLSFFLFHACTGTRVTMQLFQYNSS